MAKVVLVVRILLGLVFFAFGMIGILNLVKAELPAGDAGVFSGILMTHGYMKFISLLEIIAGLLLLVGRFVPLGLVILGPILVNILLYHLLLDPKGIAPGIVVTLMEVFLIWAYRRSFRGLFDASPEIY
ncbi:MAG: DoxX family protein [Acidobacteriaceae bacterium]|nr:DoxX family protein [Acidobacteriaceae bacterium]